MPHMRAMPTPRVDFETTGKTMTPHQEKIIIEFYNSYLDKGNLRDAVIFKTEQEMQGMNEIAYTRDTGRKKDLLAWHLWDKGKKMLTEWAKNRNLRILGM